MIRIFPDRRGAAALEFALLAPVFCGALVGVIETGRMLWTSQALSEAAYSTARCHVVNTTLCATQAQQVAYARARAASNGISVAASGVAIRGASGCRGHVGATEIALSAPFNSPLGGMFSFPQTVSATACMPVL